ncbi:glycine-rich protein DOT1-like [Amblyraja radiata]|uniref:glycine-rich protein DOT1-like n=1 Tax=Amblyraja radiata TaxID=386614 RepID=UPI0014030BB3|nr:glycine-rich protein DOT1-like [Amblyraja radiata]
MGGGAGQWGRAGDDRRWRLPISARTGRRGWPMGAGGGGRLMIDGGGYQSARGWGGRGREGDDRRWRLPISARMGGGAGQWGVGGGGTWDGRVMIDGGGCQSARGWAAGLANGERAGAEDEVGGWSGSRAGASSVGPAVGAGRRERPAVGASLHRIGGVGDTGGGGGKSSGGSSAAIVSRGSGGYAG